MRTTRLGRWSPVAVAGTVLLLVAACGGGSDASDDAAAASGTKKPLTEKQMVAAANKEGEVTFYTSLSEEDVPKVEAGFNKVYPGIKLVVLRQSSDQIPAKVLTEQQAGKYNADVVSGPPPHMPALINAGGMQPYDPPDMAPIPSSLKTPKGYPGVYNIVVKTIGWNPVALKKNNLPTPTTWEDFTKPEWKGKFSIASNTIDMYSSMISYMGHDKALELLQAIGKNEPRLVESQTQAATEVQAGEPVATLSALGHTSAQLKADTPDRFDFAMTNPVLTTTTLIGLVKNAPHPNAAKLFINWMVSKPGQEVVVSTHRTSLRDDVENNTTIWNPEKWTPAFAAADTGVEEYAQLQEEYETALGVR